jgi:hypothetical protein
MTGLQLHPKTRRVPVSSLRPGHIVMESSGHPAFVVRIAFRGALDQRVNVYCRYTWQESSEVSWRLRDAWLDGATLVDRAV